MSARIRVHRLDRQRSPRKVAHYELPELRLTEQQRVELAHRAWAARTDLLRLAPLMPAWSTRLLCHVRLAVELADLLLPEPQRSLTNQSESADE
jgi:hypothetical protein